MSPAELQMSAGRGPLHELETELAEKNQLVEALTAQLERAAEELDRLQRSGADRRRSGALPPEVVDDHRALLGEMQRVVQQWEDLQAGFALGRIEVQLTELREFVGERLIGPVLGVPIETSSPAVVITEPAAHRGGQIEHAEPGHLNQETAANAGGSAWDQLKSQLLQEADSTDSTAAALPAAEPLPDPPLAIDLKAASPAALAEAVERRDGYIAALLRRLRAAEELALPTDWTSLSPTAPGLVENLQQLARQLEEKLRLTEVELSLERANVSRAQMRVVAQQEAIDKQLKRLGVSTIDELVGHASSMTSTPDRRWVRFLGAKRK